MKNSKERALYLQNLYINAGRIIMDKIFSRYKNYINFDCIDYYFSCPDSLCSIYDPAFAFCDTLCKKYIRNINKENSPTIYIIMSPYHRNDVICGIFVNSNVQFNLNLYKASQCEATSLYTNVFSATEIKYLQLAEDLFDISNKIQQKL